MTTLYRIEELCTSGWTLIDEKYVGLPKDQTKEILDQLISDGYNPNSLRAIAEVF